MEFSDAEREYLQAQPLARISTVSPDGQPDVSPVGFRFDGRDLWVMGRDITRTYKYKNVKAGNHKVAIVVDDLASRDPWRPRMLKLFGRAEIVERDGRPWLRITPERKWSFGLEPAAA
jgi:pyridoxamine 5'-phosphate oxidase family protein